jgi:hypothetical protein
MGTFSVKDIIAFLGEEFNLERVGEDTDLYLDLDISGDDFFELIADYSKRFNVDVSEYLWYFHSDEQSINIGAWFVKPPNKRVRRIAVTPKLLTQFANTGKWEINYPPHALPEKRWDLIINRILALLALGGMCVAVMGMT